MYKLLHLLPPETAHNLAIWALSKKLVPTANLPRKEKKLFGLTFPNVVGMAAGFDKNAVAIEGLFKLGFGFVEVGTVTPRAQAGNPKPRIFRLSEDGAIINRLGFNNKGIDVFLANVVRAKRTGILGINIGANKDTENFIDDYAKLIPLVTPYADYITINISSPNTPGLRALQTKEAIRELLLKVMEIRAKQSTQKPLLVKIAPDLNDADIENITSALLEAEVGGVIATNTTIARPELASKYKNEQGGLSGKPVFEVSTNVVRKIKSHAGGKLPIIAVGGIFSAADAKAKLDAGADLVQIYTGLIYKGAKLVREIVESD